MASNNTLTGRNGEFYVVVPTGDAIKRVARITQWSVNPTVATSTEWGDSDGAGYTNRQPGRLDCTFTAEGKYDTTAEVWDLFQIGDRATAVLWMDDTRYWDFPCAICTEFSMTVDIDTEEVIGWTSSWGADGIFYEPGNPSANSRTQS